MEAGGNSGNKEKSQREKGRGSREYGLDHTGKAKGFAGGTRPDAGAAGTADGHFKIRFG